MSLQQGFYGFSFLFFFFESYIFPQLSDAIEIFS